MLQQYNNSNHNSSISHSRKTGIVTVENADKFVGLSKGYFHFFHFMEFLILAFTESLHLNVHTNIQWWYTPLLTPYEICGSAGGINCLVLQWMLFPSSASLPTSLHPTRVYGLEVNSPTMQTWHPSYQGILRHRSKWNHTPAAVPSSTHSIDINDIDDYINNNATQQQQQQRHDDMLNQVDVLLLIHRDACHQEERHHRMHKIWTNYLDSFPRKIWNHRLVQSLQQGIGTTPIQEETKQQSTEKETADHSTTTWMTTSPSSSPQQVPKQVISPHPPPPLQMQSTQQNSTIIKIGYIDRQHTNRRIPNEFHDWLVQYLQSHPSVDFYHLHMEQYSAVLQIQYAHQLDMIVGVHGNGLTHQFWMPPYPSYFVLEFFWNYPFQYDYASSAMLMNHTYRGLYNGVILNETRIANRDSKMLLCCRDDESSTATGNTTSHYYQQQQWNHTSAQIAVQNFVEKALALRRKRT
jgi:hypothetical protein